MFEKLSRRTQQLADSMVNRVDNLIKEFEKISKHNRELKHAVQTLLRDYQGLLSIPEIREILRKEEIEKNEYINALIKEYDQATPIQQS